MRIRNSLKNILYGLSGQIISTIMGFVVRSVFIYTLGIQYLGLDGLFTGILIMLSLANLGFDTAMIYSLYKPLAENDTHKIQALMNLYQKAYRRVGIVVLLLGLSLMPFLPHLINGETNIANINLIYLLFLMNSALSYFFVHKQSILLADQRYHVISKIHSVFTIVSNSIQILLLLFTGNYIVVLISQIAFRIIENIYLANKVNKLYPYLHQKNDAKLSPAELKLFYENLYALMLYKISAVVIHGTDNIIISKVVGIIWVGVYSNYLLIMNTLSTFLSYLFDSITASVGHLTVIESSEKKYFIFRVLSFTNFWIYGFCAVSLWNLINPVITVWVGERYVFDKLIVFAIIVNFFTSGVQNAPTTFRDTTGLFKKGKYRPVIAAGLNIVLSVTLALKIGVAGVFLGTVISRLCTYFWYDPYVLYKFVFREPLVKYFIGYSRFALLVAAGGVITDTLGGMFDVGAIFNIVIRGIFCILIPNAIFFIVFRRSEEFLYLWNMVSTLRSAVTAKLTARKSYSAS
jgi:O-antigen/teichoic acid export membrane protein